MALPSELSRALGIHSLSVSWEPQGNNVPCLALPSSDSPALRPSAPSGGRTVAATGNPAFSETHTRPGQADLWFCSLLRQRWAWSGCHSRNLGNECWRDNHRPHSSALSQKCFCSPDQVHAALLLAHSLRTTSRAGVPQCPRVVLPFPHHLSGVRLKGRMGSADLVIGQSAVDDCPRQWALNRKWTQMLRAWS